MSQTKSTGDSVRSYLRDIGRIPLLDHDEEILLGRKVQRLMEIKACEDLANTATTEDLAAVLGMTVKNLKREIREGEKVRTQFFRGVVIQIKGEGLSKSFTIRKMSGTVGIERIFPFNLPTIKKIEVNKKGKVRRSRIYYFKELRGKKARIKEVKK